MFLRINTNSLITSRLINATTSSSCNGGALIVSLNQHSSISLSSHLSKQYQLLNNNSGCNDRYYSSLRAGSNKRFMLKESMKRKKRSMDLGNIDRRKETPAKQKSTTATTTTKDAEGKLKTKKSDYNEKMIRMKSSLLEEYLEQEDEEEEMEMARKKGDNAMQQEEEDEDDGLDSQLNFDINEDEGYRQDEDEDDDDMFVKEGETPEFIQENKQAIDEEMRIEYWARQMALRDSLKNDGGNFLLNEHEYKEPIKRYKKLARHLMAKRRQEKIAEAEEQRMEELDRYQMEADQNNGIDSRTSEQGAIVDDAVLDQLLSAEDRKALERQKKKQHKQQVEEYDEDDDEEDQDDDEYEDQDDGLPDLTRLQPYTPVPAPIDIVADFIEAKKQELLKKTDEAADEFERQRKIKRIEFIAYKKALQHRQRLENLKKRGMDQKPDLGEAPLVIDPHIFHRFQSGEITEQEMLELCKQKDDSLDDYFPSTAAAEQDQDLDDDDDSNSSKKQREFLLHWKIGTVELPSRLKRKIAQCIKGYSTDKLREDAATLSDALRERTRSEKLSAKSPVVIKPEDKPVITYGQGQALAYISHRLPGVYGCTHRVFSEIATRAPNFKPKTMLDFGSGPGTVIWSAREIWGESLEKIRAVEPSSFMIDVAKKMLEGDTNDIRWTQFLNTNARGAAGLSGREIPENEQSDLVVASYVLSELPDQATRERVVKDLWAYVKPTGMLVLVEPGTPIGFGLIKESRQMLIDLPPQSLTVHKSVKAQVFGPCPHSNQCPMGHNSWCHFSQRIVRPVFQKLAKGPQSTVPFEDEKYSYIAMTKLVESTIPNQLDKQIGIYGQENLQPTKEWSRLIEAPLKRGGHVIMDVCTPDVDIKRATVARSHGRQMYKEARKSFWSDAFKLDKDKVDWMIARIQKRGGEEAEAEQLKKQLEEAAAKKQKKYSVQNNVLSVVEEIKKEQDKRALLEKKNNINSGSSTTTKKQQQDWMNDMDNADRSILQQLIKQGKFSANEQSNLFGGDDKYSIPEPVIEDGEMSSNSKDNNKFPAPGEYGSKSMDFAFEEDADDIPDDEDADKKSTVNKQELVESAKSRFHRKQKLEQDLKALKRQQMTPQERLEADRAELEEKKKWDGRIHNPKRLEYYLERFDQLEEPISPAAVLEKELEKQSTLQDMAKKYKDTKGLGIASKTMREKISKQKDYKERVKILREKVKLNDLTNNNNDDNTK
ncbi:hypothetical protein CYY_005320 [Polysphondylium violaceum]|uniref:Uncharacterized protein n=1 Tax=Polysphondylium violaceum TaxID=133409 RepID=A0A8J4PTE7_9MYCE|nr:hypothetical protein CYY_005320 [Polysphondylium violaceum]